MALKYKMAGYLRDFTCIGGECEDTCCKGWDIRFDQKHYELLEAAVRQQGGAESKTLRRYVKVNEPESRTEQNYALLTLQKNGACPFLQTDGWCRLHKKFGVKPLSNICAYFPRVLSRYGDTVEMSGALSCPEIVRQCLFSEQGMELVPFEPDILPRPDDYPLTRELDLPTGEYYYEQFLAVREVLLKLLELEGFPLSSRLYFLSSFASRLGPFYHHEAEAQHRSQLKKELERALQVSTLERLNEFASRYVSADPVAIIVVQAILQLRVQHYPDEPHTRLVQDILRHYEQNLPAPLQHATLDGALPAAEMWTLFQQQQAKIDKAFGLELEHCLSRYLYNCLLREWFITMPDLFTYIHMLTIRIAILRFLLYSHPAIITLAEQQAATDASSDDLTALRKELVKVVYLHSRAIDHNTSFLKVVYDAINEQQMMNFEYALPFIRF